MGELSEKIPNVQRRLRNIFDESSSSQLSSPTSSSARGDSDYCARENSYSKLPTEENQLPSSALSSGSSPVVVASCLVLYTIVSLTIVYFNWWLFTKAFQYPVFVSWIQQVFGLVLFIVFAFLGRSCTLLSHFPLRRPAWSTARHVFPLSLSFTASIGLANLCLKFVQVSIYQLARSLTLLFTVTLSYAILGESQSVATILSTGLMVTGFVIGSLDPAALSTAGVLTGLLSSAFLAFYNVTVKRVLKYTDNSPTLLLYYNLWWSSLLFIPIVYISGEREVFSILHFNPSHTGYFVQWGSLLFSGILATAMNLVSYWCIKVTSPSTFNVVAFTKSVFQSLGGILILGDLVSSQSLIGLLLSLGGSGWYSYHRIRESRSTSRKTEQSQLELAREETAVDLRKVLEEELALVIEQQQPSDKPVTIGVRAMEDGVSTTPASSRSVNNDSVFSSTGGGWQLESADACELLDASTKEFCAESVPGVVRIGKTYPEYC